MEASEENTGACPCASQEVSHPPAAFGSLHSPGWDECECVTRPPAHPLGHRSWCPLWRTRYGNVPNQAPLELRGT